MNSSTSQMIPGAARAMKKPFFFWRLMGSRPLWLDAVWLDAVADAEPGLLPQGVHVDGKLKFGHAFAEVGRQHDGGQQGGRQDLLLDQDLRRHAGQRLHVAVEADVLDDVRQVEEII